MKKSFKVPDKRDEKLFKDAIEFCIKTYGGPTVAIREVMNAFILAMYGTFHPKYIYAYCKTGLLVVRNSDGSTNIDWRPKKDMDEFVAAQLEYETLTSEWEKQNG